MSQRNISDPNATEDSAPVPDGVESCGRVLFEPDEQMNFLTGEVIGAAIEVHRILGPGFLESVYEEAMCVELTLRGIPFVRQYAGKLDYKGHTVGEHRLDLLIKGRLIVELKSVEVLTPIHTAQVISYLKATGHRVGLLLNFNVRRLIDGVRRIVLTEDGQSKVLREPESPIRRRST